MPSVKLNTIDRPHPNMRVKKIYQSPGLPAQLIVGSLCLDCRAFEIRTDGRAVRVTPAEFDLLYYMMSRPGQVFSAEELLSLVWQYPPGMGRTVLVRAHIKNLRHKIEDDPKNPLRLRTVGHLGYMISDS